MKWAGRRDRRVATRICLVLPFTLDNPRCLIYFPEGGNPNETAFMMDMIARSDKLSCV
jgi:hypothetical protein